MKLKPLLFMNNSVNRKSVTFIELIIGISLFMVIILAATSFNLMSYEFVRSSERKTEVLNELTFIADHLHKYVNEGIGDYTNKGVRVLNDFTLEIRDDIKNTPQDYNDDIWHRYRYDSNGKKLFYLEDIESPNQEKLLSSRVMNMVFSESKSGVSVKALTLQYDPKQEFHPRNNPKVSLDAGNLNGEIFSFPGSHSLWRKIN